MKLTEREPGKTGVCFETRARADQFHRHAVQCGTFCSFPIEEPIAGIWACDWWPPFQSESIHGEALMLDEVRGLVGEGAVR